MGKISPGLLLSANTRSPMRSPQECHSSRFPQGLLVQSSAWGKREKSGTSRLRYWALLDTEVGVGCSGPGPLAVDRGGARRSEEPLRSGRYNCSDGRLARCGIHSRLTEPDPAIVFHPRPSGAHQGCRKLNNCRSPPLGAFPSRGLVPEVGRESPLEGNDLGGRNKRRQVRQSGQSRADRLDFTSGPGDERSRLSRTSDLRFGSVLDQPLM